MGNASSSDVVARLERHEKKEQKQAMRRPPKQEDDLFMDDGVSESCDELCAFAQRSTLLFSLRGLTLTNSNMKKRLRTMRRDIVLRRLLRTRMRKTLRRALST